MGQREGPLSSCPLTNIGGSLRDIFLIVLISRKHNPIHNSLYPHNLELRVFVECEEFVKQPLYNNILN